MIDFQQMESALDGIPVGVHEQVGLCIGVRMPPSNMGDDRLVFVPIRLSGRSGWDEAILGVPIDFGAVLGIGGDVVGVAGTPLVLGDDHASLGESGDETLVGDGLAHGDIS